MLRRPIIGVALLASCRGEQGERGSASFATEAVDLRDGFVRLCATVRATSKAVEQLPRRALIASAPRVEQLEIPRHAQAQDISQG